MKSITAIKKYSLLIPAFLFSASISTAVFAHDDVNHQALAAQYEAAAQVMQAKADEQIEILENKSRTSFLGRNGKTTKMRIAGKIHKFSEAAAEKLALADYHLKMSEKTVVTQLN